MAERRGLTPSPTLYFFLLTRDIFYEMSGRIVIEEASWSDHEV